MKRAISLMLSLLMCLPLCACKKEKGIALTLENYKNYLVVEDKSTLVRREADNSWEADVTDIKSVFSVAGVSTNHIYKDVEIDFALKVVYQVFNWDTWTSEQKAIDKTLTVRCNVAGNGELVDIHPTGTLFSKDNIELFYCEIVEIRGTVVEA